MSSRPRTDFPRTRQHDPLPGLTNHETTQACKCILQEKHVAIPAAAQSGTGAHVPALSSVQCNVEHYWTVRQEFTYMEQFCKYMEEMKLSKSPVKTLTVKEIMQGCKCLIKSKGSKPSSTTTAVTASSDEGSEPTATNASETDSSLATTASDADATSAPMSSPSSSSSASLFSGCAVAPPANATATVNAGSNRHLTLRDMEAGQTMLYADGSTQLNDTAMDVTAAVSACATYFQEYDSYDGRQFNVFVNASQPGWGCLIAQYGNNVLNGSEAAAPGVECSYVYYGDEN
ncbi:hypothetical protein ANO11243_075910 [Dothideomycetidae sp. 11243]|nr:hypothetical protein ANO11243_075910 [fungal sp. No.11243]